MRKYIIIFIFIFIFIFIVNNLNNNECFENHIIFLTSKQLELILIENSDNYYNTFNNNDMKVRQINSILEYHEKIKNSVTDNNDDKIITLINKIDHAFESINYPYLDGKKFNKIPWKIGFVKGTEYENGFPHTRNDIIILPIEYPISANVLIHEKIHVYQKLYPDDIKKYLDENNFIKYKLSDYLGRANPDIDKYLYKKDMDIYYSRYNDNPNSITDVTYYPINDSTLEHPYEMMAYNLSNKIII